MAAGFLGTKGVAEEKGRLLRLPAPGNVENEAVLIHRHCLKRTHGQHTWSESVATVSLGLESCV